MNEKKTSRRAGSPRYPLPPPNSSARYTHHVVNGPCRRDGKREGQGQQGVASGRVHRVLLKSGERLKKKKREMERWLAPASPKRVQCRVGRVKLWRARWAAAPRCGAEPRAAQRLRPPSPTFAFAATPPRPAPGGGGCGRKTALSCAVKAEHSAAAKGLKMDVKSEQGVIKKRGVMRDEGQWHPTPFRSKNKKTTPLSDRHAHSKNDFFFYTITHHAS